MAAMRPSVTREVAAIGLAAQPVDDLGILDEQVVHERRIRHLLSPTGANPSARGTAGEPLFAGCAAHRFPTVTLL